MKKIISVACISFCLIFGYSLPVHAAPVLSGKIMDLTNQQRVKTGLQLLSANPRLMKAAVLFGEDILKNQYYSNDSRLNKSGIQFLKQVKYNYTDYAWITYTDDTTAEAVIADALSSKDSKGWLLSKDYTETGVAVFEGKVSGTKAGFVVQFFGSEKKAKPSKIVKKTTPLVTTLPLASSQPIIKYRVLIPYFFPTITPSSGSTLQPQQSISAEQRVANVASCIQAENNRYEAAVQAADNNLGDSGMYLSGRANQIHQSLADDHQSHLNQCGSI